MKLTDEQEALVRQLAADGESLGTIQKRLESDFGIVITYMEARFLVSDLEVSLAGPEKEKAEEDETEDAPEEGADSSSDAEDAPAAGGDGAVSVSLDQITIPGTMVSGKVTFSDGEKAGWYVDQAGRLGLDVETEGYKPSEEDLRTFQVELQKAVQGGGM